MSTVSQSSLWSCTLGNMLIALFKEKHVAKHLTHSTETFALKLLQTVVSDHHESPKKFLARFNSQKDKFSGF